MIPIYKPYLSDSILKYAYNAIDSGWLSKGKYLNIVQEHLQNLLNVKHVLLTNNGTSATHLVSKALQYKLNIKNKQDIIVPDNVYVAAWNSFLYDNKFNFITIPADIESWNFDLSKLNDKKNILIVHNLGNIINVPALKRKFPNSIFVEDNCEGFLGKYENKYSGTVSLASSISFFGNKNITSGEGGAFITNDTDLYEYVNCIHGQGESNEKFIHSHLGYNYRMTNVQAALLLGQLEVLDEIIEKKKVIFNEYRLHFANREDIKIQKIDNNTEHSNWMFAIRIIGNKGYKHAKYYFENNGIEIRPMFYPISTHSHLIKNNIKFNDISISTLLNKECLILPSYPELTKKEILYIIKHVNEYSKGLI